MADNVWQRPTCIRWPKGKRHKHSGGGAARSRTATDLQVILAEKRTALATLRNGIAVMVLPMTVISFLVATSRLYDILD